MSIFVILSLNRDTSDSIFNTGVRVKLGIANDQIPHVYINDNHMLKQSKQASVRKLPMCGACNEYFSYATVNPTQTGDRQMKVVIKLGDVIEETCNICDGRKHEQLRVDALQSSVEGRTYFAHQINLYLTCYGNLMPSYP